MTKTVIIQGSSRSTGNTNKIINHINNSSNFDVIDLYDKNINHFDYEFNNKNDDFIPLIKNVLEKYDTIIFATPVYWYSMSGILKVFFDRLSDLLYVEKDLGRKLKGKNMAMISCGSGPGLKDEFSMPFIESANYLGMNYLGNVHTWLENDNEISKEVKSDLLNFLSKLN
ncbi:MAG: FMN reductase [Lutibacter sp.]|nr:MAG: FMN reductase [Lutibacter sp.]